MFVFQIQVGRAVSGDRQAEGEATDSTDGRHRLGQCRATSLKNKPLLFCFVFDYFIYNKEMVNFLNSESHPLNVFDILLEIWTEILCIYYYFSIIVCKY